MSQDNNTTREHPEYTDDPQKVLNITYHLLVEQGERSCSDGMACVMLTADEKRCAVGQWLPKEMAYRCDQEGYSLPGTIAGVYRDEYPKTCSFLEAHKDLLLDLQHAHDDRSSEKPFTQSWPMNISKVAKKYGLEDPTST